MLHGRLVLFVLTRVVIFCSRAVTILERLNFLLKVRDRAGFVWKGWNTFASRVFGTVFRSRGIHGVMFFQGGELKASFCPFGLSNRTFIRALG